MSVNPPKQCLMGEYDDLSRNSSLTEVQRGDCEFSSCTASLLLCKDGVTEVVAGACNIELKRCAAHYSPKMAQELPLLNPNYSDKNIA